MTKVSLNMCYVMGNVQRMGNRFFLGLASQLRSGGMCSSLFGEYWRVPCCCSCLAFSWTKYNSKCVSWWHVFISIWTSIEVDGMCSSLFGRLLNLMACVHLYLDDYWSWWHVFISIWTIIEVDGMCSSLFGEHWSHFQPWSGAVPEKKSGMSMRKES